MKGGGQDGQLAKAVLAGELCYTRHLRSAEMFQISSEAPPRGRIVGCAPDFREVAEPPQQRKEGIRCHPDSTPARAFGTVLGVQSQRAIPILSAWHGEPVNRAACAADLSSGCGCVSPRGERAIPANAVRTKRT